MFDIINPDSAWNRFRKEKCLFLVVSKPPLAVYGTVDGNQTSSTGTGIAEGTCNGSYFISTGESIATGTRLSSLLTPNALNGNELDKKQYAKFSKDGNIFSFIAH
jgi:hypothetical protein